MQDKYLTLQGCKIRYRDTGCAGMPVLFSHGITGSLEFWEPQHVAALSHLRLISWDFPNHGLSDLSGKPEDFDSYADWALDFVQALQLDNFIAVGNSMGAAMSLRLAELAPSRVAGLVMANSAALGREVTPIFRLFSLPFLSELLNKPSEKALICKSRPLPRIQHRYHPRCGQRSHAMCIKTAAMRPFWRRCAGHLGCADKTRRSGKKAKISYPPLAALR